MANCQYGCEVMKGEVRCQCPSPGLQLAPDGRTCVGTAARCEPNKLCYFTLNSKALSYEEAQHREALPLPPSPSGSWLLFNSDLQLSNQTQGSFVAFFGASGESVKDDKQSFVIQIAANKYTDSLVALRSCGIPAALDNRTMSSFFSFSLRCSNYRASAWRLHSGIR